MKRPRISTLIIIVQFVLLLVSLGFLGFFILQGWVSQMVAKDYAYQAGYGEAMRNFLRHDYSVYEMKFYTYGDDTGPIPNDGMTEPAGKMDEKLPVYYFLVNKSPWKFYAEIEQQYIDGYNRRMRAYFDHPELFDQYGLPVSRGESRSGTNTLDSPQ
jgi:hypothetical protein